MSWLSDSSPLVSGWLSSAYAGHGVEGSQVPPEGVNPASTIADALEGGPVAGVEYRLFAHSLPAGLTLDENGRGIYTGTASRITVALTLYADGVEVP